MPVSLTSTVPVRRSRAAVSVAYGVQGLSLAILVTRIPTVRDRLGLSEVGLGLLLVLVPVMAGVGSVLAGILTARLHSRPVLRVAGPFVPLSVVAVGLAPSLPAAVIALSVFGVAIGMVDATMNMQAVSLQAAYGRPVISSCYAWFSLVSIAGALLAAGAAATDIPLWLFFAACAAVAVPVQLVVGRWLLPDAVVGAVDSERTVPWAPVIAVGIALMCAYVLDSATQNWSAVYLTDALGAQESVAALGYAAYSALLLIGRLAVDRIDMRAGPVRLVRAAAILGLVGLLVVALAPDPTVALIGFGILGLAVAPMIPLAFVAAASHDRDATGRAVARVNVFNYVGVLLGAPLVGIIAEASSLRIAFAALGIACVAIFALARAYLPAAEAARD